MGASVTQPSVTTVAVNEAQVNDAVNDGTLYRFFASSARLLTPSIAVVNEQNFRKDC
jgi:hypothetical protein